MEWLSCSINMIADKLEDMEAAAKPASNRDLAAVLWFARIKSAVKPPPASVAASVTFAGSSALSWRGRKFADKPRRI